MYKYICMCVVFSCRVRFKCSSKNATTTIFYNLRFVVAHRPILLRGSSNTLSSFALCSTLSGTPRSNNLVSKSSFSASLSTLMTRTLSKSSKLAPPVALLAHSKYSSSSVNEKLKTTAFAFSGIVEENSSSSSSSFLFLPSFSFSRDDDAFADAAFLFRPFEDEDEEEKHGKHRFVVASKFPMLSLRNISGVHPSLAISSLYASNGL